MELRALRKSPPRGAEVVGTGLSRAEAQAFYRDHTAEVLNRMRKPTNQTRNPAAEIVAQCETDPRLRTEALCAVDDARRARDARDVLQRALDVYAPMRRPALFELRPRVRSRH